MKLEIENNALKIVFLDAGTLFGVPSLHDLNKLGTLVIYENTSPNQTAQRLADADIAITNKIVIDKNVLDQCTKLKLICVAATGTNNIDLTYAAEKNVVVKNVSNYSTQSVAQVVFSMILYLLNQPKHYDEYVKSGEYAKSEYFTNISVPFWQLSGKRLGIIGLGNIGKEVAKIGLGFGMEVVYTSISGKNHDKNYTQIGLDELLQTSDIVSLHTPLTSQTKGIINYDKLKLMQKHALLINVSRGGLIVEQDLAKALNENLIYGAGIDVFESEPIMLSNPLLMIKHKTKIVLSPHIGWASIEARTLLVEKIIENIKTYTAASN